MGKKKSVKDSRQYEAFVGAAKAAECDESEEKFNAALGKVARHKPAAFPDAEDAGSRSKTKKPESTKKI